MDVKRNYLRCSLTGEGQIATESVAETFEVVDISASGALINIPFDLNPGDRCELNFSFRSETTHFSFYTKGIIVRKEIQGSKSIFGVHFINLDEKSRVELDEIIKHNCQHSSEYSMNKCEDGDCNLQGSFMKQKKPNVSNVK